MRQVSVIDGTCCKAPLSPSADDDITGQSTNSRPTTIFTATSQSILSRRNAAHRITNLASGNTQ